MNGEDKEHVIHLLAEDKIPLAKIAELLDLSYATVQRIAVPRSTQTQRVGRVVKRYQGGRLVEYVE